MAKDHETQNSQSNDEVLMLRNKLELLRIEMQQAAQQEQRNLQNIIQQLQNNIADMRKQIEHSQFQHAQNVNELTESKNRELAMLQAAVIALRNEMEVLKHQYDNKLQAQLSDFRAEKENLQNTINQLRITLEKWNAKS